MYISSVREKKKQWSQRKCAEGEPATRGDRFEKKVILVHVESLSRIRASSTTGLPIIKVWLVSVDYPQGYYQGYYTSPLCYATPPAPVKILYLTQRLSGNSLNSVIQFLSWIMAAVGASTLSKGSKMDPLISFWKTLLTFLTSWY